MDWAEVGRTTLPQAALLQKYLPYVSPHYEVPEDPPGGAEGSFPFEGGAPGISVSGAAPPSLAPEVRAIAERFGAVTVEE